MNIRTWISDKYFNHSKSVYYRLEKRRDLSDFSLIFCFSINLLKSGFLKFAFRNFKKTYSMKHVTILCFAGLASFAIGQTNYTVNAQAATWEPKNLTIDVGDSVTWINDNQGMHNVNGTQESFPWNPESFGLIPIGANWVYGHRFNIPGTYSFRCDMYPSTMGGVLIVQDVAGISEHEMGTFTISPNPSTTSITIGTDWDDYTVSIFDMLGQPVLKKRMYQQQELDISGLQTGSYFVQIATDNNVLQQRLIKN